MRDAVRLALAEWRVVRARLLRTRLAIWMGATVALTVLMARASDPGLTLAAIRAILALSATLLAALSVAYAAGADDDRLALQLVITHPTTPGLLAAGRWAGAVALAAAGYALCAAGLLGAAPAHLWHLLAAAALCLVPLASVAALCLAVSWLAGTGAATLLIAVLILPGALSPDVMARLLGGGATAGFVAHLVHVLPTLTRATRAAAGRLPDLALCAAWLVVGLAAAAWAVAARRAWPDASP